MSLVTMSIFGLYQYDDHLFDDLSLPEGVDKNTVVNNILLESIDLETYISDPDTLKTAIKWWSLQHLPVWQHLKETTEYEYNPIWNKDGTFTETETRNLSGTKNNTQTRNLAGSSGNTETRNLAGTTGNTETRNLAGGGNTETETGVNAYNGTDYTDRDKSTTTATTSDTGTVQNAGITSDTGTIQHQGTSSDTGTVTDQGSSSDTGTVTRQRSEKGNIGITTTQQMIKEEREIAEFNIISYIVKSFIERFCILVY